VELALPFAELELRTPQPGDAWRVNFCVDGQRPMVLAPTFESYLDHAKFATMVFLAPDQPSLHLPTLGKLSYGGLQFLGSGRNPSADDVTLAFVVNAEKEGTRIVERTGFDEIVGALFAWEETVRLPAGGVAPIRLQTTLNDPRLDRIRIEASARRRDGTRTTLYRSAAELKILPPLRLEIDNYPTEENLVVRVDVTGLGAAKRPRKVTWRIVAGDGRQAMSATFVLPGLTRAETIDLSGLAPGGYTLATVVHDAAGTVLAEAAAEFDRVKNPAWFRNDIGKSRAVLPPFAPVQSEARRVSIWGRTMTWSDASILPTTVTSTGTPLLADPARLILTIDGVEQVVALDKFTVTSATDDRVDLHITGKSADIAAEVDAWVEVDGLLWLDIRLSSDAGQERIVDACRLEFSLARQDELYYHGVPDRSLTGRITDTPLEFQTQFYFWVGSCDRGFGFIIGSDRDITLGNDGVAYRLLPEADRVVWQVLLIEKPRPMTTLHYTFGLQATPVRPMPPDWHSWLAVNFRELWDPTYAEFANSVDMATIWELFKGGSESWWRSAFCDPKGVRTDKVKALVEKAHARSVPAILYSSPMNFSDAVRPEHTTYEHEWATMPRTRWKCAGFTQTRACAGSSFQDWLLYHFRNTIR
ncbi:MAG: hypothetical protein KAI66_14235, partial [Lentisphaeria bacterium]|nr:hypothetical protein [Lentisphaeria bacterium]